MVLQIRRQFKLPQEASRTATKLTQVLPYQKEDSYIQWQEEAPASESLTHDGVTRTAKA
jgi:hypothetical protein